MRLGWRPGNEAGVEAWERRGWGGGLGTRLGWRPGNEAGVEAWERGYDRYTGEQTYHDCGCDPLQSL